LSGSDFVVLGRLADPYGIRGWIRVHPFGDDPLSWAAMPLWWIGKEGGPWREVRPTGIKAHADGLVASLEGVGDRTAAESIRGLLIGAPRSELPPTAEDEYYWADLVGLEVVNTEGLRLGKVVGLLETGANDVLRVLAEDGSERLLPFVGAVVRSVEKEAGLVRVEWGSDW
jgi:16S rRNA processing protein RimM